MALDPTSPSRSRRVATGTRVGVVVSGYHAELTHAMARSARRELEAAGLGADGWLAVDAPGAYELPFLARRLARRSDVHAVLCFGLVLKGETEHDRYIAQATAGALMDVALETDTPVLFGVLTCATLEQARARALPADEGGELDKGREVARAAVDVLSAAHEIESAPGPRAQETSA